jgi:multidrug efflux pump subunit AcrB
VFLGSLQLLPSANYLPNGTREFIFCAAKPVVGQRNEVSIKAIKPVEEFAAQDDRIAGYFAVSAQPFFTGMGVMVKRELSTEKNLQELVEKLGEIGFMLPGFEFFFPMRSSIFNIPDKEFTIEITGEDLTQLKGTADRLMMQLFALEDYVVRARTEYSEGVPELGINIDRFQAAQLGLTSREIAAAIEMMVGGRDVSTYTESGREYDLMVRASDDVISNRRDLRETILQTPTGEQVRLSEIASISEGIGPSTIRHYNRQRSIQLTVNTNPALSTQEALDAVEEQIVKPAREGLAADYSIRFGEAADKLRTTINSLVFQGAFAIFIVYLLMVSLFRSFRYPLVILVTIPLAWSGSFVALSLAYKLSDGIIQFDILGMLGLIILTGIVVNNAILIIHQMQNNEAEGMSPLEALKESSRTRLRPIAMSVLTSTFGMLPLALGQGSGSELYRGLGLVVVGGLLISTLFTLFVVPTILSLIQQYMEQRNIKEFGKAAVDRHRSVDKD